MPANTTVTIGSTTLTYGPDGSLTTAAANTTTTLIAVLANLCEVARDHVFTVVATGLKPSTLHKFYMGGVDYSSACVPILPTCGKIGGPLVTDGNGRITFKLHYMAAYQTVNITNIVDWEKSKQMFTSTITCILSTTDQTSYAQYILTSAHEQCLVDWHRVVPCALSAQDLFNSCPITGTHFAVT